MQENQTIKLINRSIYAANRMLSLLLLFGVALIIGSIMIGAMLNPMAYLALLILIPIFAAGFYLSDKVKKLRLLSNLRENWGIKYPDKDRDLFAVRLLYDEADDFEALHRIDDQTWKDLNMDEVYGLIDRTLTDPGEAVLYRILRSPSFSEAELKERSRIIRLLTADQSLRESIQIPLARMGHQYVRNDLFNSIWGDSLPTNRYRPVFFFLSIAAMISPIIPIIFGSGLIVLIPVGIFILNLVLHYLSRRKYRAFVYSFPGLLSSVRTARTLAGTSLPGLESLTEKLKIASTGASRILKKTRFLLPEKDTPSASPLEIGFEYLNIFYLLEVQSFYSAAAEINRQRENLKTIYLILGELDALLSIASFRTGLDEFCEPEFKTDGISLEITNGWYPLLQKPVPATVKFDRNGVVVTGSNMSGKSTFLRNIGCNVLLAQTIVTCTASAYRSSYFRVMTSISRTDDVLAGKSFYFVEAERLHRIITDLDNNIPSLCIIDELLSGTNSVERISASDAIIRYLIEQRVLVICATHDIELIERLSDRCDLYHFTGTADKNGLTFDYELKKGPATSRNAIQLLEYLGYPKEILDRAKDGI